MQKRFNRTKAFLASVFTAVVSFFLAGGSQVEAATYYSQSLPQTGAQVTRTALIVGVILLLVGGFFFFRNRKNKK
ncbi:LPXTG cell wall anchor domain-containing protein [Aerococcus urinae]